ncbi:MAG: hypothetical protein RIT45_1738 [Pseudomonadota bacterium]|jgi:hypothetical protein
MSLGSSTASRVRRLALTGAFVLGASLASGGCGPVSTASTISDADRDLEECTSLEAERRAPYEFTKARALLEKAKELEGYGQYESATNFARQSRTMSEKAIDVARLAAEREKRDEKFGKRKAPKADGGER